MKYDQDLLFLQDCPNEQLKCLCDILTHDSDGELRMSEKLTGTDNYLQCYPDDMDLMWEDIAGELQKFGGNTFMNLYRHGEGVLYAEIVDDACHKLEVEFEPSWDIARKEKALTDHLIDKALENMSPEEKKEFLRELNVPRKRLTRQAVVLGMQLTLKAGGRFMAPFITNIVNTLVRMILGRGVAVVTSGIMGRVLSVAAGPLGWAATAAWTAADIASPAFRVTIPAIIQVGLMRNAYGR